MIRHCAAALGKGLPLPAGYAFVTNHPGRSESATDVETQYWGAPMACCGRGESTSAYRELDADTHAHSSE